MSWSAQQYTQFEDDRTRPVRDLLAAIPAATAARAIDLGCGPGNSTELLVRRFPDAEITGLDSSPDMLAAARKRLPGTEFAQADIATWDDPGPFGAILANAVLHWLPQHETLLPRLAQKLTEGGSLAVQMPDNLDEPASALMRQVAQDGPWSAKLAAASGARTVLGNAAWYYNVLKPQCRRVDIWRTTYSHVLPGGPDAIVEWFKGSGLRVFLDPLTGDERESYLDRYHQAVAQAYPALADGSVLLPFPRLFMVATR